MQGKEPSADSASIEAQAAEWLARRDGSSWTEADEIGFLAWQEEDTLHRVAVLRLKAAWVHADRLQVVGAGLARGTENPADDDWLLLPRLDQQRRLSHPPASRDSSQIYSPITSCLGHCGLTGRRRRVADDLAISGVAIHLIQHFDRRYGGRDAGGRLEAHTQHR